MNPNAQLRRVDNVSSGESACEGTCDRERAAKNTEMKIVGNKKASAKSSGSRIWRAVAWEYASATSTVVSRIAAEDSAIGRINTSRGLFMVRPTKRCCPPCPL